MKTFGIFLAGLVCGLPLGYLSPFQVGFVPYFVCSMILLYLAMRITARQPVASKS